MANCEHSRTLQVSAKASDCQVHAVPHLDIEREGYAPRIDGLCSGDYINFTVCLDCGVVTSMPLDLVADDSDLYEAFDIEPLFWNGGDDNEHLRDDDFLDKMGR